MQQHILVLVDQSDYIPKFHHANTFKTKTFLI